MIDLETQLRDALDQRALATTLTHPPLSALRVTGARRRPTVLLAVALGAVVATVIGLIALGARGTSRLGPTSDGSGWRVLPAAPISYRDDPAAVWTGSQLLVWGGGTFNSPPTSDGAALDVATGQWILLPAAPLSARRNPISVWTGTEMLVWGGTDAGALPLADGAAYNPTSRTWRPIRTAPIDRTIASFASTVWTGSELLIWGGDGPDGQPRSNGAAYNPATDRWRTLRPSPLRARHEASTVWTGREMLVWGGSPAPGPGFKAFDDGAAYNPITDSWRSIAASPLDGRIAPAIWTGSEMIVAGGRTKDDSFDTFGDGAAYDPEADTWHRIADGPGLALQATWTGSEMLTFAKGFGFDYDPASNTWRSLAPAGFQTNAERVLWTGHDVLLVGTTSVGTTSTGIVAAYTP